jgi:Metallo-beta-lactamase superfamily
VRKDIVVNLEILGSSTVGASCILLTAAGRRILIDAGVRLGSGPGDMLPDLAQLQDGGIDAVLVTHAHATTRSTSGVPASEAGCTYGRGGSIARTTRCGPKACRCPSRCAVPNLA